jgi:alpha-galactosidase/6-phospho-beta-glucosidase family protein
MFVMAGLVPSIHVFAAPKAWMAGTTSPAMTATEASLRSVDFLSLSHNV